MNISSISNNIKENYFLNRKVQSTVTNNYTDYEKLPLFIMPKFNYENYTEQNTHNDKENQEKKRLLK